jgi:hypothetical protein
LPSSVGGIIEVADPIIVIPIGLFWDSNLTVEGEVREAREGRLPVGYRVFYVWGGGRGTMRKMITYFTLLMVRTMQYV